MEIDIEISCSEIILLWLVWCLAMSSYHFYQKGRVEGFLEASCQTVPVMTDYYTDYCEKIE